MKVMIGRNTAGVTLREMLLVIGMSLILAALLAPVVGTVIR